MSALLRHEVASLLAMVLLVGGCGSSAGGEEPVDGAARLEQQRADVREAAQDLLAGAEKALPGTVTTSGGQYRGCEGAFPDEYRTFNYEANGRVDVVGSQATAPFLDPLREVLEQAGFTVAAEPEQLAKGLVALRGTRDDLTATFTHTGGSFVGLGVSGPCLEVPEDTRDQWLGREEPDLV